MVETKGERIKKIEEKLFHVENVTQPAESLADIFSIEKKILGSLSTETSLLDDEYSQLITFYFDFKEVHIEKKNGQTILTFLDTSIRNGEVRITEFSINAGTIAYISEPTRQYITEEKCTLYERKLTQGKAVNVKLHMKNGTAFNLLIKTDERYYQQNEPLSYVSALTDM